MAAHNIKISITASNQGAKKAIAEVQQQMQSLGRTKVDGSGMNGLSSGARQAAGSVREATGAVGGLSSALGAIKGVVAGAFAVGSIVSFGKAALEASANFEFLKKGLNFQVGVEQTNQIISQMQQLGETSAYDSNQLIPMARKWVNVGANADVAIQRMKMIVDAGSAFGLTAEQIGLCTDALTKMSSEGKINAEDMNALNDDGIPAWQLLSEAMGKPVSELREMSSKSQLTQDAVDALFQGITNRTQGATASMNDTLSAAFANMNETAENSLAGIGDIIVKTFDVKGKLQGLGEIAEEFKQAVANINSSIDQGGDPTQAILNELSAVSPVAGAVGNTIVAAFRSVASVIQENADLIKSLVVFFGSLAGTYVVINQIMTAFTALKSAITAVSVAMRVLGVAAKIASLAMSINPVALGLGLLVGVIALVAMNWDTISAAASAAWESIKSGVSNTVEWISNGFNGLVETLSGVWESITSTVSSVWDGIVEVVSSVFTTISDIITTAINFYVGLWSPVLEAASEVFDSIVEVASEAWNAIVEDVSPVIDTLGELWQGFLNMLSAIWDSIVETATAAWDGIVSAATAAWNAVSNAVSAAWNFIVGIWGAAVSWFENTVWTPVKTAVSGVKTAISDAFQGAYDRVIGIFKGLANWFDSNVVQPIKDKINSLTNIGATITGSFTSNGKSSILEAKGGINGGPMRLAYGGMVGGNIPMLANGGQTKNGTHAIIGEAGPEAVIPLKDEVLSKIGLAIWDATASRLDFKRQEKAAKARAKAISASGGGNSGGAVDAIYTNAAAHLGEQWGSNTCAAFATAMIKAAGANTSLGSNLVQSLVEQAGSANHPASEGGSPKKGDLVYWMRDGETDGNPYMHVGIADGQGGHIASNTHGVMHADTLSGDYYGNGYYYGGYISMNEVTGATATSGKKSKSNSAQAKAAKEAEKAAADQAKANANAQEMLNELKMSMFKATGTDYQKDMAETMDNTIKKLEKIQELKEEGVDDTTIQQLKDAALAYNQVLQNEVIKKHKQALRTMELDSNNAYAESIHDYEAMSDVKYEKAVAELDQEREKKQQELMSSEDDYETLATITTWYYDQLKQLQEEHDKDLRESHQKKIQYLQEEGNIAGIYADIQNNPDKWQADADDQGKKDIAQQVADNAKLIAQWNSMPAIVSSIGDAVQSQLVDSMTDFISLSKSAKDVFSDLGKTILNTMAKIAAQKLAATWMNGIFKGFHFSDGGEVDGYAVGGYISGPGTGTSDSIPAWLSNGEYVMTADATKKYLPTLEMMNAGKFATGGFVAPTLSPSVYSGAAMPAKTTTQGNSGGVVVNITNKSNGEARVENTSFDESMQRWVIDVVVDAASRNRNGFASNMKSALRGAM